MIRGEEFWERLKIAGILAIFPQRLITPHLNDSGLVRWFTAPGLRIIRVLGREFPDHVDHRFEVLFGDRVVNHHLAVLVPKDPVLIAEGRYVISPGLFSRLAE